MFPSSGFRWATAARGGIQITGSCSLPLAWPRSGPGRRLRRGRDQVHIGGFVVAEIRCCSAALPWPRSGPVRRLRFCWLLRGSGMSQPFHGCRIGCRYPRECAWVRGSSGQGAWHPPAISWVPYTSWVSSRLSAASGVPWSLLGCQGWFSLRDGSRFCRCCWVILFVVAAGCYHALWVCGPF